MSSNFIVKRICEQCKEIFDARTTVTRFCSSFCNRRSSRQKKQIGVMKDMNLEVQSIIDKPTKDLQAKEFLSVNNVAKLLGTSTKMIYRMIEGRKLVAVNLSVRKTVIHRSEIDRLFKIRSYSSLMEEEDLISPELKDCYCMKEAQEKFSVSEAGLFHLIKKHNLTKFKEGRYVYIAKKDLDIIFSPGFK